MAISAIIGAFGVSKALGLGEISNQAIDQACNLIFDKNGKEILDEISSRLRAHTGSVPLNHDLEHAIRLSELTALLVLLRHYRQVLEAEALDDRAARLPYAFIGKLNAWLLDQIGLSTSMTLKPNEVIVSEIEASLDLLLSETKVAAIAQDLAKASEQVWAAMVIGVGAPPLDFEEIFHGRREGQPGWSLLFVAFIREALKTKPRVEVAYLTTRLSGAREALRRIESNLNSIIDRTISLQSDVSEILLLIRQKQHARRAAQDGIPETSLHNAINYKYFDTKTRDIIRSKFATYRQEHQIALPQLAARVGECLVSGNEVSVKTLKRFMKGIRVDDSFVALLVDFAETLPASYIPAISPDLESGLRVELAVNERAEVIIFHNKPFAYPVNGFEFNADTNRLRLVTVGGYYRDFGVLIRPELYGYLSRARRLLIVHIDENTGEPIEGGYLPFLVATDLVIDN